MSNASFIARHGQRIREGQALLTRKREVSHQNLLASDTTLYSYGHHFPLLFQIETPSGEKVTVCNSYTYSVSTSRHISYARQYADVCAPLGRVSVWEGVPSYEKVLTSLIDARRNILNSMQSKKRKNTSIYRHLERRLHELITAIDLLA